MESLKNILLHFFLGGAFITLIALSFGNDSTGWDFAIMCIFNGLIWVALAFGNGFIQEQTKKIYSWIDAPGKRLMLVTASTLIFTVLTGYVFFSSIPPTILRL